MMSFKCARCGKRSRGKGEWNVTLAQGVITSVTCPDCQTTEENAEATIHEATLNYGRDAFGRVIGSPK
jgi:DNA-directed RNA polymerase subunit RPC12/RpoP